MCAYSFNPTIFSSSSLSISHASCFPSFAIRQRSIAPERERRNIRHDYRLLDPEYAKITVSRLFGEGHIATGRFSYDQCLFAEEAATLNEVGTGGKQVWQREPSGPSTLHNCIVVTDDFTSPVPCLEPLAKSCRKGRQAARQAGHKVRSATL